jgi:aminomethyltransferase
VSQKRVGILSKSKSILRSKMKLFNENNQNIGTITSGGYSPTLNTSIAMAYINRNFLKNSSKILCSIRNNMEEVELTNLPFIKHNYRKGSI